MGRIRIHKQNTKAQIQSVQAKSLHLWLINQTRNRFGIAVQEAEHIAEKAEVFMNNGQDLFLGNRFFIPLPVGKMNHQKKTITHYDTCLTAFTYDDSEIHLKLGLKAMQNNRIFRMIEEAYAQNTILSAYDLCLLTHITAKSIRGRLIPLWNQGIRLPVRGMAHKYRNHHQFRSTYALHQYFSGIPIQKLQAFLFFSNALWHRWQRDFSQVAWHLRNSKRIEHISLSVNIPLEVVVEYSSLVQQIHNQQLYKTFMATYEGCTVATVDMCSRPIDLDSLFLQDLEENHNFSKAKSRLYLQMLHQLKEQFSKTERELRTVLYYAVSSDESPGKPLSECSLIPIQLAWWTQEDQKTTDLNSTENLKWQKIVRFTTEARNQGACLNQADLAYLLAVHPNVIQKLVKEHEDILLPTRGNVADMGPGLSHAEQIIELYLQGYTETEIVRRSGHTYGSIENYIMMFSRVVSLLVRKMPLPLIRQTIGCSMKLVEKHAALYQKYNTPDYQFMLMQIRRIFETHDSTKIKKNQNKLYKRRSIWDDPRKG